MWRIVLAVVLGCITASAATIACFNTSGRALGAGTPGTAPRFVHAIHDGPLRDGVEQAGLTMPEDKTEQGTRSVFASAGAVRAGVVSFERHFVYTGAGRTGFPFRDAAWHIHYAVGMRDGKAVQFASGSTPIRGKFTLPWPGSRDYQLPHSVRPVGLALNGLVHIGLFLLLFVGIGAMRRRRRAAQGRCLACGYTQVGGGPCPECGHRTQPA